MGDFFDLDLEENREAYIEEGFIAEIQYTISRLLREKGVSRSDFARKLGVSPAYVSQMLGDGGANLTSRTIAKAFIALGEEPAVCTKRFLAKCENVSQSQSARDAVSPDAGWFGLLLDSQRGWEVEYELPTPSRAVNDDQGWGTVITFPRKRAA